MRLSFSVCFLSLFNGFFHELSKIIKHYHYIVSQCVESKHFTTTICLSFSVSNFNIHSFLLYSSFVPDLPSSKIKQITFFRITLLCQLRANLISCSFTQMLVFKYGYFSSFCEQIQLKDSYC